MVSTREVYRIVGIKRISFDREKRSTLSEHFANLAGGNTMALESDERFLCRFRSDGHQQASRSLWIEEQILMLGSDARCKRGAVAYKSAIILESAGEMTFAGCFEGAREIIESGVINLERNGGDAVRRIAKSHLSSVAEQTESGYVGDGVNTRRVA